MKHVLVSDTILVMEGEHDLSAFHVGSVISDHTTGNSRHGCLVVDDSKLSWQ